MQKYQTIGSVIVIAIISAAILSSCQSKGSSPEDSSAAEKIHQQFSERILQLESAVNRLLLFAESQLRNSGEKSRVNNVGQYDEDTIEEKDLRRLQLLFKEARYAYKRTEYLTELYFPYTAKSLNGAPIDEVEMDDPNEVVIPAEGFQVIEELLFPTLHPSYSEEFIALLKQLSSNIHRLKVVTASTAFTDSHIFNALRMEIFRVITLGISGFDSPAALNSMIEAKVTLNEMGKIFSVYQPLLEKQNSPLVRDFPNLIQQAEAYLDENQQFATFDRLTFITQYANPLSEKLWEVQQALNIPFMEGEAAIAPEAKTLFDAGAFNTAYFAPAYNKKSTAQQIALGELLFFDPVLSGNNSRACASCHQPEKAFTDNQKKSLAFDKEGIALRNAPTILNAGLQASLFHDGRVVWLEDQVTDVVLNPLEMHGNFQEAVAFLENSAEYNHLFTQAFEDTTQSAVSEEKIQMALAAYVRSKVALNSRFDRYMRGDTSQLSKQEKQGFNLFMGKAACGTCHFVPLFNGTLPPFYKVAESEIIGVPNISEEKGRQLDADMGKFGFSGKELHRFAFKTTTVRNAGLTAPYMHNGVFETLEELMDFYNKGGGIGLGLNVPHQTLSSDPLELTEKEVEAVIAFMEALNDTTGLVGRPTRLPSLQGKSTMANSRSIGGEY